MLEHWKRILLAEDRRNFFLRGYPADVWVVGNNPKGALWIADKGGVFKTKSEAQALVAGPEIQAEQAAMGCFDRWNKKLTQVNIRPADVKFQYNGT